MNLYDVTVSACRGAMTPHVHSVNLGEWLATNHEHRANKKDSAAIMPHGMFHTRRAADFQYSSGLVQVDLDAKDNPGISNWHEVVHALGTLDSVAYANISVSGAGCFVLVNVLGLVGHPFVAVANRAIEYITDQGFIADEKVSRNLASLRFMPFSPDTAYWNLQSVSL
jgi:hypothetical protein